MMEREKFIIFIKSIGFKDHSGLYEFKGFFIDLFPIDIFTSTYHFYNGVYWIYDIILNDLTPLENNFKRELRSIKLKQLLRW